MYELKNSLSNVKRDLNECDRSVKIRHRAQILRSSNSPKKASHVLEPVVSMIALGLKGGGERGLKRANQIGGAALTALQVGKVGQAK